MLIRELKGLRSLIAAAFIACLALPGSAFATVMLDLTDSGPFGSTSPYPSGSSLIDPLGLGWNITITASGGSNLTVNGNGTGVEGNGSDDLNADEWINFAFVPEAMLAGFTIVSGTGDNVLYAAMGSIPDSGLSFITDDPQPIVVTATASSLFIGTTGIAPGASGYRVGSLYFVPEPAVLGLLGLGLLGMGGVRRMKKAV